ncbi:MAG TPA: sugar phosphate nucleotidyltransferase [Polyangiaceae bacterium]|nr:sugar phosphate nucleotidyltransferase [Polyangiaceae bacterium]
MTSALILAAGFGTRLHPLTLELPKPVVPVGDRPLLAHVAEACHLAGAERLVANAHHEHQKLCAIINELKLGVEVVVEPELRGTAGGVAGARRLLGEGPVLVWNGDILAEPPAARLLAEARDPRAQVLAVSPRRLGEGSVGLDEEGRVVRLRGRIFGREIRSGDYIGVMALGANVVAALPPRGCLIGDVALRALERGQRVSAVESAGAWSDLGDLAAYVEANFRWLDQAGRTVWLAPGSRVGPEVRLERSLIGDRVEVGGSGLVREVIAWPGARFSAPLSFAVVLGSGRVVPFDAAAAAEN